jgi:hypothetical protein
MPTLKDFYMLADQAELLPEWKGDTPDKMFIFMILAYVLVDCIEDPEIRKDIFSQRFKMSRDTAGQIFNLTGKLRSKAENMIKTYTAVLQN